MPRACIIVLDAVGVGEPPDAAAYGDAGVDTLGQRRRGGRRPRPAEPRSELGLGNVMPLAGCPPTDAPPAVVGTLRDASAGKDTTTGHWELMGIVTPEAMPTFPDGFPPDLDAFVRGDRPRRARQRAGVGHRDHPARSATST